MSTPQMPPRIPPEQLANLSKKDLGDYVNQIAMAAIAQCRENKEQFLKQHPALDFLNSK